mmetsp:Transcript_2328/g.9313  ORF Transcript_2328/g.9313 Transcript_2328/m.9313 type:complete len:371 (+) Transcript_2328:117-1229(+)
MRMGQPSLSLVAPEVAVAFPRRPVNALLVTPLLHPVPAFRQRQGARPGPFKLVHDVLAALEVPHLEQPKEVHAPAFPHRGHAPVARAALADAHDVLYLARVTVFQAVPQHLALMDEPLERADLLHLELAGLGAGRVLHAQRLRALHIRHLHLGPAGDARTRAVEARQPARVALEEFVVLAFERDRRGIIPIGGRQHALGRPPGGGVRRRGPGVEHFVVVDLEVAHVGVLSTQLVHVGHEVQAHRGGAWLGRLELAQLARVCHRPAERVGGEGLAGVVAEALRERRAGRGARRPIGAARGGALRQPQRAQWVGRHTRGRPPRALAAVRLLRAIAIRTRGGLPIPRALVLVLALLFAGCLSAKRHQRANGAL